MKALFLRRAISSLVFGCAIFVTAWLALTSFTGGTYAAPDTPSASGIAPSRSPSGMMPSLAGCWSTYAVPPVSGNSYDTVDVDALSPSDVWAAGNQSGTSGGFAPLIYHWNGSAWSIVPSPSGDGVWTVVTSMDAAAPDSVWVAGYVFEGTIDVSFVMRWDGTGWSVMNTPDIGTITDISALSPDDVWVISFQQTMHWDGSQWTVHNLPVGTFGYGTSIKGVAPNDVWAGATMSNSVPKVLRWNGTQWNVVTMSGQVSEASAFLDFAVITPNDVWAVGWYASAGSIHRTLIAHWNGAAWTAVPSPNPPGESIELTSVSGTATNDVWAVGRVENSGGVYYTLLMHWDGSAWTMVPSPAGATDGFLASVAVVSATDVWAVGAAVIPNTSGWLTPLVLRYTDPCSPPTPTPGPTATATATPLPPRCPGERFTDVCPGDYFYEPVLYLNDRDIISGYSTAPPCDGAAHIPCFKPYNGSTRGQISKIVSLAAGFKEPVSGQTFEDVTPGSTFYPYIERMASRSIIQGYACGAVGEPCVPPANRPYFRPNNPVTRGQLSKMTSESFGFSEPVSGQTFEDVAPGSTFYQWVQRIASRGIIQGYLCGNVPGEPCVPPADRPYFRPHNPVTRGQTSKIVQLAMTQPTSTPITTSTPTHTATPTPTFTATSTSESTQQATSTTEPTLLPTSTATSTSRELSTFPAVGITARDHSNRKLATYDPTAPGVLGVLTCDPNWTVIPGPQQRGLLYGVDAASANDVWAVGNDIGGSITGTLIEHWDGVEWSIVPRSYLQTIAKEGWQR